MVPKARHLVLVLAVISAVIASPASALSPSNRCLDYADRYSVVDQTPDGLLFAKPVAGGQLVYGCLFSDELSRKLPFQDPLGPPLANATASKLNGRYAAFILTLEEPAAGGSADIVVYDVRAARTQTRELAVVKRPEDIGGEFDFGDGIVDSFVHKKNGSVAWVGHYIRDTGERVPNPPGADLIVTERVYEVRRVSAGQPMGNEELDIGTEIAPGSLALSYDRTTVLWKNAGAAAASSLD